MLCCENCRYARLACNTDYVGCAHWFNADFTYNEVMDKLNIETLATGWVYLGRYPEQKEAPDTAVAANLMTNGVVCFKKNFICKCYEGR